MADEDPLQTVVAAIADGTTVDWSAIEFSTRSPGERALLHQLKAIATLAAPERPRAVLDEASRVSPAAVGYGLILAVATFKVALAFVAWGLSWWNADATAAPMSPYIINIAVFGIGAAVLVLGGTHDRRARRLGALFLIIASAFSDPLLLEMRRYDELRALAVVLPAVPTDAFLAVALWRFVWSFPTPPIRASDQRMTRFFVQTSLAMGVALFAANIVLMFAGSSALPKTVRAAAAFFDRRSPAGAYWLALFSVAAPATPYLLWKARFEAAAERKRTTFFAASVAAGMTPMLLAVILSPFLDFFHDPSNRAVLGVFLYLCLLAVVPLTAYAVFVHRVLDIQLIVTRTLQYSLVRYAVWLACVAPLGSLIAYVYTNRDMTVSEMVSTRASVVLLPLPLVGLLLLTFRDQLLQAIDRRFLAAPPDYQELLPRLDRDLREAQGVGQVAATLTREIDRALHPRWLDMLVLNEDGDALVSPTDAVRPLRAQSSLGKLLSQARQEIYAGTDASGPVARLLPREDRQWLTETGVQLLVPLIASTGDLIGALAIGDKRSGLPLSKSDRLLLASLAAHGALILENRCLVEGSRHSTVGRLVGIDWNDEPGTHCSRCGSMWPARTMTCECGTGTIAAALPFLACRKFRVQRFIRSGGMSVVYLATDIALNRKVAIKTLPHLAPDAAFRLQQEARAMASVLHPNLAMIFAVESWRGSPLLIVEYLESGTLADRLERGPLEPAEAIDLGIVLADVLDRVHASGVLHRDVKPSNIGYTRGGVPKLMDFGVARLLEHDPVPGGSTTDPDVTSLTWADRIIGTPLYMSPEAVGGAGPNPLFDVWSLAVVLYEAIGGRNPFEAPTVTEVLENVLHLPVPDLRDSCADCHPEIAAFFKRALARDRTDRPDSAADLRNRLRRLRADLDANSD
jgi:hypothetical protein